MEKKRDEIQARREKALLAKAAAEVIAKEGPTKSIKEVQKMLHNPEALSKSASGSESHESRQQELEHEDAPESEHKSEHEESENKHEDQEHESDYENSAQHHESDVPEPPPRDDESEEGENKEEEE